MANFDLSKLMEGKNPQSVMLEETRQLKGKWESTGLLEGLNAKEQGAMSVLLENQAKQLLDEASSTGTAANSEEWSGVALPLVRRIFGEIASKEFVSVQPMNLPSGLVFYLDFKYGTATAGRSTGAAGSLFGGAGGANVGAGFGQTKSAENGLYGAGAFGYSVNEASTNVASGDSPFVSASHADVGYDGALSASIEAGDIQKITIAKSDIADTLDVDALSSIIVTGAAVTGETYGQFAKVDGTDIVLFVNTTAARGGANIAVAHSLIPADYNRGDFEDTDGSATNLDIPEVDLELKSEAIVAKTRKLKAVWTPELAQDLNAYHSIDAEAELTSMLSDYISLEIDLEILDMLKSKLLKL